jgi:hypothetical protein
LKPTLEVQVKQDMEKREAERKEMNTVIGPRMSNSELQKKFELSQLNKLKEREDY